MRVFTPKIAEQVINRGWHVSTHVFRDHAGNLEVTRELELDYDYCTSDAMQMLVDWQQQFQTFTANFKYIDREIAGKIARISCDFLFLRKLEALEISEAKRLSHSICVLTIGIQSEPSPEVIEVLVNPARNYLIELQLSTLSVENARVLANDPGEFSLELPFQALRPTVITILSGHIGRQINLALTGFDGVKAHAEQVLEALSTPFKQAACVYLDSEVVRIQFEERDWGRWKRRMDRRRRVNDQIAG